MSLECFGIALMEPSKKWSLYYRGSLSSCNYGCEYCPFAKTKNTRAELLQDKKELEAFERWTASQPQAQFQILLTPWGEGLIRKHYQEAMTRWSHQPNVSKIAIQTNLSSSLEWMKQVNKERFALWTTFHPSEASLESFVEKSSYLLHQQIKHSVGIVGVKENFEWIEKLNNQLPQEVYLWINAYKREKNYYTPQEIAWLESIDPLFRFNNQYHPSLGEKCESGWTSFSILGDGSVRRCHFIPQVIGNIYQQSLEEIRNRKNCTQETCGCHIGLIHIDKLGLYSVFGEGLMERIPQAFQQRKVVL